MTQVKAVPEGMHTLTPQLTIAGCDQAIEWYKLAFGAELRGRAPDPSGKKVWHAEMRIGSSIFFLNDAFPEMGGPAQTASLWLYSDDVDQWWKRAVEAGAKIDSFGVGTKMGTSADRPYLDVIYKLSETMSANGAFAPIMKLSEEKNTLPGRKQVYRFKSAEGIFEKDVIALADEDAQGEPLLAQVMKKGKLTYNLPSLREICECAAENLANLPQQYKALMNAPIYPVELSNKLQDLLKKIKLRLTQNEINDAVYRHA